MKKRLFSLFLALLLLTLLLPAAFAEESAPPEEAPAAEEAAAEAPAEEEAAAPEDSAAPVFPHVLDNAKLLSGSRREELEQKAAALSEQHQCALYIVTVEDYTSLSYDVYEAAKGIFTHYDLGLGEERNGVLLLLSMKEHDYSFAGHGTLGETICGYESSWLIEDAFLDNLRDGDWAGGFSDFLDACGDQLTKLEKGEDVGEGAEILQAPDGLEYHAYNYPYAERERSIVPRLLAVILIPLAVALAVCSVFKAQMKTAHEASDADEYLVPHSVRLRIREDRFTHRTETRTRIDTDSGPRGGSSGGGSSFHSGGGFSGRSGKF